MQEDDLLVGRRDFLRLGAMGLAAVVGPLAEGQVGDGRGGVKDAVMLRSSELEVTVDAADGVPVGYRMVGSGVRFAGETEGVGLKARVCSKSPWTFADVGVGLVEKKAAGPKVDLRYRASYATGVPAAEFTVRYVVDARSLFVTMEDVKEFAEFELISVALPGLVTVRESDAGAWLAHGDSGGDLVMLKEAKAGVLGANSFWGHIAGTLPVVMVGHGGAVCVQETTAYMDETLQSVLGGAGERRGRIGTTQVYRVDGGDCYNMNLGSTVPRNCGNQATPNLPVGQRSSCRLDFQEGTWLDGAKLVRGRMPGIPNRFYDDKYIYGIRTDEPKFPKPSATFEQAGEMIRRMAALTDGTPQLVHLWGWQFRGKDTGYPAVNVVDERLGGYEGMMALMAKGPGMNTTISLSDNYDDAYRSSPAWDEATIARSPDGKLWKSREWTGEESYIQGLAKYMEGPGPERVKYTCERYRLPGTIHVDVLSYFAIRNDWDPVKPASGIRNLYAGRYRVMEEFRKHGVDVTSEGLRYPYIGKMSMSWYAGGPSPCPFGGRPIPMLSLIYKQSAVWGRASMKGVSLTLQQAALFYGEAIHSIYNGDTPLETMLDAFYLVMVPWFRVNHRNVEGFLRDGETTTTVLAGEGNRVEVDWASKGCRLVLDGAEVMREGAVMCPLGKDRVAMYSVEGGELTATLPKGWDSAAVKAFALGPDRKEAVKFSVEGRKVTVAMTARRPVMLYRGGSGV